MSGNADSSKATAFGAFVIFSLPLSDPNKSIPHQKAEGPVLCSGMLVMLKYRQAWHTPLSFFSWTAINANFFYVTPPSFFWNYNLLQHFRLKCPWCTALIPKRLQFRWRLCALAEQSHFILLIWNSSYQCSGVYAPSEFYFSARMERWKKKDGKHRILLFHFTHISIQLSNKTTWGKS